MEKISVDEYRRYLEEYYYWEIDNNPDSLAKRREVIAKLSDDALLKIINDTYLFAEYLLKKLKSDNKILEDKIFACIYVSGENKLIMNGCTGGHFSDNLFEIEFDGITTYVSKHIMRIIFDEISIEDDYDIDTREDGDVYCEYPIPFMCFSIQLDTFNKVYSELIESVSKELK